MLSSDRPPAALSRLAERLRDRFAWGLTVSLEPPDLRTRMVLLWRLAAGASGEPPDTAVLREIAARAPGNVRLLEGAMTRVLALSSLLSEPLAPAIVRRALAPAAAPSGGHGHAPPSLEAIQDAVCAVQGITAAELRSPLRSPRIAHSRQLAMYLARQLTGLSLAQIARGFDRDHTTVMHAVRAVSARIEPDSDTQAAIQEIHRLLAIQNPPGAGGSVPIPDPGINPQD